MSCNGCRVLRKRCKDTCVLRSSLCWIESPEAQGNATLFLAKFFGRSDLLSLISSVPESQRPALFQSLLFEACGRTVNPVNGAVGLLCSGDWHICQAAVDTVFQGGALRPIPEIIAGVWTPSCNKSSDRFSGNSSYHFQNHYAESKPLMRMMMDNQTASTVSDLSLSLMTKFGGGRRGGRRYKEEKKRAKAMPLYSEESEITISESNENEGSQKRKILKLFV
ncbi:LOB domain-containing protein 39 [Hibiscus syriacus]|uniref:LOB domain-containing protein 39 n=1 Tax=Hibiscus syriacus TaxID=106335 RepID=A0A6A3BHZ8_HIBSY|nr:LOB domain-containing protein 38-like [Hibiscus syriacus]KAE8715647.1 LOB domain-containing protein 39 [Hibiscus syriacus]